MINNLGYVFYTVKSSVHWQIRRKDSSLMFFSFIFGSFQADLFGLWGGGCANAPITPPLPLHLHLDRSLACYTSVLSWNLDQCEQPFMQIVLIQARCHYDFTTDKVCHSLKFINKCNQLLSNQSHLIWGINHK